MHMVLHSADAQQPASAFIEHLPQEAVEMLALVDGDGRAAFFGAENNVVIC